MIEKLLERQYEEAHLTKSDIISDIRNYNGFSIVQFHHYQIQSFRKNKYPYH